MIILTKYYWFLKVLIISVFAASLVLVVFPDKPQADAEKKIVFKDASDESTAIYNRIAGFIIENGFSGYSVDYLTLPGLAAANNILRNEIDIDFAIVPGKTEFGYGFSQSAGFGFTKRNMVPLADSVISASALIDKSMYTKAPEVIAFLENFVLFIENYEQKLPELIERGFSTEMSVEYFLENEAEIWSQWIPSHIEERIVLAL